MSSYEWDPPEIRDWDQETRAGEARCLPLGLIFVAAAAVCYPRRHCYPRSYYPWGCYPRYGCYPDGCYPRY